MFLVGADENGLGPVLGPLVATAVVLEVESYSASKYRAVGKKLGIDDSKANSGFGKMAHAEGITLAALERLHGQRPEHIDQLLTFVTWRHGAETPPPCPRESWPQCWSTSVELPAFGGTIDDGHRVLDRLEKAAIRICDIRSAVVCASLINSEVKRLGSRLRLDLSLFERLLLETRAVLPSDVEAFCGKVGGIDYYPNYFRHLIGYTVEAQTRASSTYRIAGLGRVTFEIDADATHLPVSFASMVGKYVRELQMERQNRYYLRYDSSLKKVSGYRDKHTRKFIASTRELRQKLAIRDQCFER
jgi:ribonuclease HII